jgi:hypothetical protein
MEADRVQPREYLAKEMTRKAFSRAPNRNGVKEVKEQRREAHNKSFIAIQSY